MSKSYRKPYSAITGVRSAAHDKMVARRCWRRAQEQALRDCTDYEELIIPKRLEASFNDVWSWGRDGKQSLQTLNHNDLNPYYCTSHCNYKSFEQFIEIHEEIVARHLGWLRDLTRK